MAGGDLEPGGALKTRRGGRRPRSKMGKVAIQVRDHGIYPNKL
jgi:hypothetical protein